MPELKYLLFLGCVIPYRLASYETSARKVAAKLGIELVDMQESNCCGLPMDPVSHEVMLTLAARNLCFAEQQNLNIVTLCPGCAGTLRKVNKLLREDKKIKEEVNGYLNQLGLEFKGTIVAKHIMQVLAEDVGFEKIKGTITKPLSRIRVAVHYGCHVMRPFKYIDFDNPENPMVMNRLIELTGAKRLNYMDETECCGAPISGLNEKIPLQLAGDKLSHIKAAGAQALITVCPYCHIMFDVNQSRIERTINETFGIPVLHYTQLLGLSMGLSPSELGLEELRVSAAKIVSLI